MPDMEEVIDALSCCGNTEPFYHAHCDECPYNGLRGGRGCVTLPLDALELLKKQKTIAKLGDAPTVSGWVSVKDRLPEPEENVIIWTKTGCMKYAQYHEDGSINPWYVYEDNARAWTNVISHWMPLPEPPKEGQKDA